MLKRHQFPRLAIAAILAVLVCTSLSGGALADQFDEQINAARSAAQAAQSQASSFHAQANDARTKINQLNAQINALQSQINLGQAQSAKLQAQMDEAKTRLAQQKQVLGAIVRTMYFDSNVSPLEMLASSSNISDFLDQAQYQESVRSKIQSAMQEIQTLQRTLQDQQATLAKLLDNQKNQQQSLAETRVQANQLLTLATQNANAADAQVRSNNAQVATLKAQQAAAIAAASRRVSFRGGPSGAGGDCSTSDGNGGYPALWCNAAQDSLVDSWGMYNRECVSYAAWATSVRFGHNMPYWGGRGNANQWPANARAAGIPVDNSPKVGDVAIWMGGSYGHAMIVEQVKNSAVIVSSMNADNNGHFQYDEWATSQLVFLHFR